MAGCSEKEASMNTRLKGTNRRKQDAIYKSFRLRKQPRKSNGGGLPPPREASLVVLFKKIGTRNYLKLNKTLSFGLGSVPCFR